MPTASGDGNFNFVLMSFLEKFQESVDKLTAVVNQQTETVNALFTENASLADNYCDLAQRVMNLENKAPNDFNSVLKAIDEHKQ